MAAAAAEPSGSTIESLFGPSTRFRDVHQNLRGGLPEGWTEVELLQDLTLEDVLATGNRLAPDDADLAILLRALANNRGLVDLDLRHHSTSDENWTIFFESLQAHPTLTSLDVQSTIPTGTLFYIRLEHYQASRMRMIADMMEHNTLTDHPRIGRTTNTKLTNSKMLNSNRRWWMPKMTRHSCLIIKTVSLIQVSIGTRKLEACSFVD
jgi:hypothetical protein